MRRCASPHRGGGARSRGSRGEEGACEEPTVGRTSTDTNAPPLPPLAEEDTEFNDLLVQIQRNITTHLAIIQTLSEANVIEIQVQILAGDYSFFTAADHLKAYQAAVDSYYPDGTCGQCEEAYMCGSTCCNDIDYPTCCPAFPGQKEYDSCISADGTCCTDEFSCNSGYTCSAEAQTCCASGDSGCPNSGGTCA